MNIRHDLIAIFRQALAAVDGRLAVRDYLQRHVIAPPDSTIALGKAACAMTLGARDVFGAGIDGLVVTKYGHLTPECRTMPSIRLHEAGHPQPDAESLNAGRAVLEFISSRADPAELLFLISGGASALVEVLRAPLTLTDLRRVNSWLIGSGLDIHEVNAIRKRISLIKGGQLARQLGRRRATVLLVSDVPGDDPDVIGSGLLFPDQSVIPPEKLRERPDWLSNLLRAAPPLPDLSDPCFVNVRHAVVASNAMARHAAAQKARAAGYVAHEHSALMTEDVALVAAEIASTLLAGPAGLHIWGGEPTVRLPPNPGRGGRNQHLALAVAKQLAGRSDVWFLAGATDGTDGPTDCAGAVVDGETLDRGRQRGADVAQALANADAATFLEAAGDLLHTGPTGTNVMDLWLGLRAPAP